MVAVDWAAVVAAMEVVAMAAVDSAPAAAEEQMVNMCDFHSPRSLCHTHSTRRHRRIRRLRQTGSYPHTYLSAMALEAAAVVVQIGKLLQEILTVVLQVSQLAW